MPSSMLYTAPLGELTLTAEDGLLTGLWLKGQQHYLASYPQLPPQAEEAAPFAEVRAWLDAYFAGKRPDGNDLPLAPHGTEYQRRVWQLLLEIPYGQVVSYGTLAQALGDTTARAVGGAVARNPISIIIPCHRVVGADGSLTGYAGGVENKLWLLRHEGVGIRREGARA